MIFKKLFKCHNIPVNKSKIYFLKISDKKHLSKKYINTKYTHGVCVVDAPFSLWALAALSPPRSRAPVNHFNSAISTSHFESLHYSSVHLKTKGA